MDRMIFLLRIHETDFDSDTIFPKTRFLTLGRELAKTVMKLGPKRKNTKPVTLQSVNNNKNPRQRRQFDPLSRTDQKRVILKI